MIDQLSDIQKDSLAQAVNYGQSASSWAQLNEVDFGLVREWCALPEFLEMVAGHRRETVKRVVGRLLHGSERVIDRMIEIAEKGENDSVRLSAARAVFATWLKVSQHFEFTEQVARLQERIKALQSSKRSPTGKY